MELGWAIFSIIMALVGGAAGGFFGARALFKSQLKKNPPVNEKQIRALYRQMGRTPSEAQVRAAMKAFNDAR